MTKQKRPTEAPKPGCRWVQNLMTGAWMQEREGTPYYCSVASESYWSN